MQTRYRLMLFCLLILTAVIYYPFLGSPFVFDDFYNLFALEQVSQQGLLAFVAEGFAGPTGRPVSLLSFALQHESWPRHPFHFKLVNLLIHLLNGVLVWFISRRLFAILESRQRQQNLFALLATALWLLHPMHLTTVLYTVQRMTQLSSLFTLLGVAGYIVLRARLENEIKPARYIVTGVYVLGCALLATLSKENGILLLLFIPVLELTLLASQPRPRYLTRWLALVVVFPLLVVLTYLVVQLPSVLQGYHYREFNAYERVITQATVLFSYLEDLLLPGYGAFTLHHDDYPLSRGLFNPPVTAIAVFGIIALFLGALVRRKQNPVFAFCILWFLAGHALESSHLNLELYFEHRNYLPSFAVCFGLAYGARLLFIRVNSLVISGGVVAIYTLLMITVLVMEGSLWNKPLKQAVEWVRLHPESMRSLNNLGTLYIGYREYEGALDVYEQMADNAPGSIYADLQIARIHECKMNHGHDWIPIMDKAGSASPAGQHIVALLDLIIVEIIKNECLSDTSVKLAELINKLLDNNKFGYMNAYLYQFGATLAVRNDQPAQALAYIDEALARRPAQDNYIFKMNLLKRMGMEKEARALIQEYEQQSTSSPMQTLFK